MMMISMLIARMTKKTRDDRDKQDGKCICEKMSIFSKKLYFQKNFLKITWKKRNSGIVSEVL